MYIYTYIYISLSLSLIVFLSNHNSNDDGFNHNNNDAETIMAIVIRLQLLAKLQATPLCSNQAAMSDLRRGSWLTCRPTSATNRAYRFRV